MEPAVHVTQPVGCRLVTGRGACRLATDRPCEAEITHPPLHRAAGNGVFFHAASGARPCRCLSFCGHLSQPKDDGGDGDDGEIVASGLFEAGGDAPELLETREAAFDEVALGVEMLV